MMSTNERPCGQQSNGPVSEILLGDALANDSELLSALPSLQDAITSDAIGDDGSTSKHFLKHVWTNYVFPSWATIQNVFVKGIACFTHADTHRILAQSVAKVNRAKAKKIEAEADAIRAAEERKNALLKYFLDQKIEMASEQQGDILHVVFTKGHTKHIEAQ